MAKFVPPKWRKDPPPPWILTNKILVSKFETLSKAFEKKFNVLSKGFEKEFDAMHQEFVQKVKDMKR
jgi:hypothetical protein